MFEKPLGSERASKKRLSVHGETQCRENTVRAPTGVPTRIGSWNRNDPKTLALSIYDRNGRKTHMYKKKTLRLCVPGRRHNKAYVFVVEFIRSSEKLVFATRNPLSSGPGISLSFGRPPAQYRTIVRIHMERPNTISSITSRTTYSVWSTVNTFVKRTDPLSAQVKLFFFFLPKHRQF